MKDKIFAVELAFDKVAAAISRNASEKVQDKRRLHCTIKKLSCPYFVLSTCRRITVFAATSCPGKTIHFFETLGVKKKHLTIYKNEQAVQHLLEIGSGLHSPNVGENEILFQLKNVLKESVFLKTLDVTLRKLLQKAIETGRRVRSETTILENNLSYPAIVQNILKEKDIKIEGQKILIIGNGKLGGNLIKYFLNKKAHITLATRNKETTYGWGKSIKVISREDITDVLEDFRIVIGAASAQNILISKHDIKALKGRRPFLIDLAMPANFDSEINSLFTDTLINLDYIFGKAREIEARKSIALEQIQSIVKQENDDYMNWLKGRKAVSIIQTLKEELEQIKQEEQSRLWNDFAEMDLQQKKIIDKLVNRLASRIAHSHYSHIKEFVVHEQS